MHEATGEESQEDGGQDVCEKRYAECSMPQERLFPCCTSRATHCPERKGKRCVQAHHQKKKWAKEGYRKSTICTCKWMLAIHSAAIGLLQANPNQLSLQVKISFVTVRDLCACFRHGGPAC